MKIRCHCGAIIFDGTDALANRCHFIPDQQWVDLDHAIDEMIDRLDLAATERSVLRTKVRRIVGDRSRRAWQCDACGRVYIEDALGKLHCYVPQDAATARSVFGVQDAQD